MSEGIQRRLMAAAIAVAALAGVQSTPLLAQQPSPPMSRPHQGLDYWQPDWMVKELWGPGRMPKGVMTRLLRQTTYMSFGIPPEYDGAKSTVEASPEVTAA
ncbi:MAG: hypothetical protein JSS20_22410, partial [Proteobacteria bacterium]|nr:hypothetical protein [Pseudomonadota bacterium]